ncbi:hypothetical protein ES708_08256 [subsurface metagenome]
MKKDVSIVLLKKREDEKDEREKGKNEQNRIKSGTL